MAKFECSLKGDFDAVLRIIEHGLSNVDNSISYDDGSDFQTGQFRCAVRVFEKFNSYRNGVVNMNIMLAGEGDNLFLSAITSGGSEILLFQGSFESRENKLIDRLKKILEEYEKVPRQ